MAELNKKEEKFRDILLDNELELDTSALYDSISDRLPKKKDRRPFLWFFLGVSVGVLGLLYVSLHDDSDTQAVVLDTSSPHEIESAADAHELNTLKNSGQQSIYQDEATVTSNVERSEVKASIVQFDSELSNDSELSFAQNSTEISKANVERIAQESIVDKRDKGQVQSLAFIAENTSSESISNDSGAQTNENATEPVIMPNEEIKKVRDELGNGLYLVSIKNLELLPSLKTQYLNSKHSLDMLAHSGPIQPVFLKQGRRWRSSIVSAIGMNVVQASYADVSQSSEEITELFGKEVSRPSLMADVLFKRSHSSGISILAGFSYGSNVSVVSDQSFNRITEQVQVTGETINSEGFVEQEITTVERTTSIYNDFQLHRHHRFFDIQLGLSQELVQISEFQLSVSGLFRYNILTKNKGYYFDVNQMNITKFAAQEDHPYNNNTSWSTKLALNLEYQLNQHSIGLMPYWVYRPGSIIDPSIGYELHENSYGLQLTFTLKPF